MNYSEETPNDSVHFVSRFISEVKTRGARF